MKQLLLFTLLFVTFSSYSQTLTFNSVQTSRSDEYQQYAKQFLGKKVTLKIYDNSISLQLQGEKEIIYLQKTSTENNYRADKTFSGYRASTIVNLNYTMGVLSSLNLEMDKFDNIGLLEKYVKATAKRF